MLLKKKLPLSMRDDPRLILEAVFDGVKNLFNIGSRGVSLIKATSSMNPKGD